MWAISSTARSKTSALALEGLFIPATLRSAATPRPGPPPPWRAARSCAEYECCDTSVKNVTSPFRRQPRIRAVTGETAWVRRLRASSTHTCLHDCGGKRLRSFYADFHSGTYWTRRERHRPGRLADR